MGTIRRMKFNNQKGTEPPRRTVAIEGEEKTVIKDKIRMKNRTKGAGQRGKKAASDSDRKKI